MLTTMGELRMLLEAMALRQDQDKWVVTADSIASMGFGSQRVKRSSDMVGYVTRGVWAPFQALKDMDAKNLSVDLQKPVPDGVTANDMLEVLKTMATMKTEAGVMLVPGPNLQHEVALQAATFCARRYQNKGIELVVTPQSSSRFAAIFGSLLADLIKAEHVDEGVVKSTDINLDRMPDHVKKTKQGKEAFKSMDRWKRNLAKGETPSLRGHFHNRMRQHVSGFMKVGDNASQHVGEGKKVLVADDIVTTGSTHHDSARALEEMGFDVVGMVAAVKEQ